MQMTLDFCGFARKTDPDTSKQAALTLETSNLEQLVLDVIKKYPNGATSDDIMEHFPNIGVQTISPRYARLLAKGFIIDTGDRRKGKAGRNQRVMVAV